MGNRVRGSSPGKRAVVIGAGLGSLACAIRLAAEGWKVTVLEAQQFPGGKLARVERQGYRFDRGPSTITMPNAFSAVFEAVGRRMEQYLDWYRIDPSTRNIFSDGHTVDLSADPERMREQIAAYSPDDAARYAAFLEEARRLRSLADRHFLNRAMATTRDMASLRLLGAFLRIRPFTSLQQLLARYFQHPNTLAMFGRYATYVGGEPGGSPALFAMLASVEADGGVYGLRGGTYELAAALARLAGELGVQFEYGASVNRIAVRDGRVLGVEATTGDYAADRVIAGGDTLSIMRDLLPQSSGSHMSESRLARYEPSLSGFVLLAGVPAVHEPLLHHTVFYPTRYGTEFDDIFRLRRLPEDPAIYVCNSSWSEPAAAPQGSSNLFILVNAPYLSSDLEWDEERTTQYRDHILQLLAERGLGPIGPTAEVLDVYTPSDMLRDASAYRGAIYGISSNGWRQTFLRPANRSPYVEGLWFVGGTSRPGGGTPIVTMNGLHVAERIIQEDRG
jgi:phytoene desaturase